MNSVLVAILCAVAPLASDSPLPLKTEAVSNFKLGREITAQIRSDYENGKYNEFLADMDGSYQKADLKEFIQMRANGGAEIQEDWEEKFLDLQKQKNQALLNVIPEEDDSVFSEKVRFLAADHLTSEQEKAVARLHSFVSLPPNSGKNADENLLIGIDLEYEYKLLHADQPELQDRLWKQIALRMEKMDKMVQASKNFEDPSLKQAVGIASATLDTRIARNLDGADLNRMAKQNHPNNTTEEAVYRILKDYQEQFSDLLKQFV